MRLSRANCSVLNVCVTIAPLTSCPRQPGTGWATDASVFGSALPRLGVRSRRSGRPQTGLTALDDVGRHARAPTTSDPAALDPIAMFAPPHVLQARAIALAERDHTTMADSSVMNATLNCNTPAPVAGSQGRIVLSKRGRKRPRLSATSTTTVSGAGS